MNSWPTDSLSFLKAILKKINHLNIWMLSFFFGFGQALYILLPAVLGELIDGVFVQKNLSLRWMLVFPSLWLVSILFSSIAKFFISFLTQDVRKATKEIFFQRILDLPSSVFVEKDAGEAEHLMSELSLNARYMFNESLPFFITAIVTLFISIFIVGMNSIYLILIFFTWLLFYVPISFFSSKSSVKLVPECLTSSAKVSGSTVDIIQNHELIFAFGTREYEEGRFRNELDNERNCYVNAQKQIDLAQRKYFSTDSWINH